MFKVRNLATLLALSSVAVLPACSMFGGGDNDRQASRASYPSQSYASAQPVAPTTQAVPMSQDTVRQVQQALQQAGLYRARVDGVWGPATEAAVRSYQQKHNLNASGELDADTLASLNLGSNQNYGNNAQPSDQRYGSNNNAPNNSATNNDAANSNTTNTNPPNTYSQPNNNYQTGSVAQPNTNTTR